MRQVPAFKNSARPRYLLVGNGRLGSHLNHYFNSLNSTCLKIDFSHWQRKQSVKLLDQHFAKTEIILLAIADSEIAEFKQQLCQKFSKKSGSTLSATKIWIHFSGALTLSGTISVHPLCSFGPNIYQDNFYKKIPFVMDKNAPYTLPEIFPALPNPPIYIEQQHKHLYHALCVLFNNMTTLLMQTTMHCMQSKLNIQPESMASLAESLVLNIQANPKAALTGPLARDDQQTLNKNLSALNESPLEATYLEMIRLFHHTQQSAPNDPHPTNHTDKHPTGDL